MSCRILACLVVASAMTAGVMSTDAQACPPGMYQTGGGNVGWVACAPMDGGGGPTWADGLDDGESWNDDQGGESAPRAAVPEYMMRARQASEQAYQMVRAAADNAAKLERMKSDPRYQRYMNGAWDIISDKTGGSGKSCVALFSKGQAIVSLVGPNPAYDGTLMIFSGPEVPRPKSVEKTSFTLGQLGMAPQTVTAFNYINAEEPWGTIAFAVPSVQAALDGIDDVQKIEITKAGQVVFRTDWSKGHAARDKWRTCMHGRKN